MKYSSKFTPSIMISNVQFVIVIDMHVIEKKNISKMIKDGKLYPILYFI